MSFNPAHKLKDESGVALVLVLLMLLLMTILGMTVLNSSTSELKISGNYRNTQDAFYTAEALMEFTQTNPDIYTSLIGAATTWPAAGGGHVFTKNVNGTFTDSGTAVTKLQNYHEFRIDTNHTARARVEFISTGAVPAGSGTEVDAGLGSGTGFKANYYAVSVIGEGVTDSAIELESSIARVVPK